MKRICEAEDKLVLENDLVSITISKADASVLEIIEKATSFDIGTQRDGSPVLAKLIC